MLINVVWDIELDPDPGSYDFGYYVFDSLHNINTDHKQETDVNVIDKATAKYKLWHSNDEIHWLQLNDVFWTHIYNILNKNHVISGSPFLIRDNN